MRILRNRVIADSDPETEESRMWTACVNVCVNVMSFSTAERDNWCDYIWTDR